jgi:hypothetical protein
MPGYAFVGEVRAFVLSSRAVNRMTGGGILNACSPG